MTTHPRNYPDDQIEHPDQGSAPDPDHYDDFIAADVLAAFIRDPDTIADLQSLHLYGALDSFYLLLNGEIRITPEQAAVLSPLFAPPSDG
jgi:hypothetical protein